MPNIYLIIIIILMLIGIICQIMLGILFQNMIKETENMTETEQKVLKACKAKFTACYQLNKGIANVGVFVDKFLNRIRLGRFTVNHLSHFSGQCILLSALIAGIGIYRGIVTGISYFNLFPYYIISFLGMYLYFSVSSVVNLSEKKSILKTNLVDYLENTLSLRLQMEAEMREEEAMSERNNERNIDRNRRVNRQGTSSRTTKRTEPEEFPYWKNNKEAKELSDLLMEYLT